MNPHADVSRPASRTPEAAVRRRLSSPSRLATTSGWRRATPVSAGPNPSGGPPRPANHAAAPTPPAATPAVPSPSAIRSRRRLTDSPPPPGFIAPTVGRRLRSDRGQRSRPWRPTGMPKGCRRTRSVCQLAVVVVAGSGPPLGVATGVSLGRSVTSVGFAAAASRARKAPRRHQVRLVRGRGVSVDGRVRVVALASGQQPVPRSDPIRVPPPVRPGCLFQNGPRHGFDRTGPSPTCAGPKGTSDTDQWI